MEVNILIKVRNLTKIYGEKTAVDNVSFDIERGKIYGFLGQNGAGKSTTMNIITGCLSATDGSVTVDGHDIFSSPIEAKRRIGYLPEIPPLYPDMTPFEYLVFVAKAKGVGNELAYRQVKEAMELTQISDVSDRLIKTLSKGYKQRVGIAQALLGSPDVIILDEPTVGLDPRQITEIRALIRRLGETRTVIISSHILAEISEVCNHVIIISHGKIVADDGIEQLEESLNKNGKLTLVVKNCTVELAERIFGGLEKVDSCTIAEEGDGLHVEVGYGFGSDPAEEIFKGLASSGCVITEMHHERLSLEDIFLRLTEGEVKEEASADESEDGYTPLFTEEQEEENDEAEEEEA